MAERDDGPGDGPHAIISRADALAAGLTLYFTGKPCKRGHMSPRGVANCGCRECGREEERLRRAKTPHYSRDQMRRLRAADPEHYRELARQWEGANKDRRREVARAWRAANREKSNDYQREWAKNNPQSRRTSERKWREANAQKFEARVRPYMREYRAANLDRLRENSRQYQRENRDRVSLWCAARLAAVRARTPAWVNLDDIAVFYLEAARLTAETGVVHEVDHIIPLRGKTVSGLHVPENLQILTADENRRKGNRMPEGLN